MFLAALFLFKELPPQGRRKKKHFACGSLQVKSKLGFLLKEVIQPQVPLRLPCYDFTPIIGPTVDGCLHDWLALRLRVKPTFVV